MLDMGVIIIVVRGIRCGTGVGQFLKWGCGVGHMTTYLAFGLTPRT